jgi:ABC-type uncharacterized transport system ATPase subunit
VLYGEVSQIKRNFAGNAIRVQGQGRFANIPGVLSTRRVNGSYEMTLAAGTRSQDIFRCLAQLEGVCIERFEIAEPSLDDIFVTIVQENQEQEALTDA